MRVIYLRQSQDRDGRAVAVARQRTECQQWADAHGWTIGATYEDNDRSASKGTRPEYQRLLADIEAGRVTGVLVWDLDRLHRQPMELEHFIALADQHSIKLGTATGETDLSTDNGRLYARIKGAVARAEVERKAERQKAKNRQQRAEGDYQPRIRPFGWRKTYDGNRAVFNELEPTEAQALATAATNIIDGTQSMYAVYFQWNKDGMLTAQGKEWTNDSFRKMLVRLRNAGLADLNGQRVKATCEPIFSEDTLDALIGMTKQRQKQNHRATRQHPFSGVADCGVCGGPIYHAVTTTEYKGEKTKYGTYACRKACVSVSARAFDYKVLRKVVWNLGAGVYGTAEEHGISGTLDDIRNERAKLADLDQDSADIMASKIGTKERLALLEGVQQQREALANNIDRLIASNRIASLIADLTLSIGPHKFSDDMDNMDRVRERFQSLPVPDQTALVRHLFSISVAPAPGKGRQTEAVTRERITVRDRSTGEIV